VSHADYVHVPSETIRIPLSREGYEGVIERYVQMDVFGGSKRDMVFVALVYVPHDYVVERWWLIDYGLEDQQRSLENTLNNYTTYARMERLEGFREGS
jgi:hypothetical protein